MENTHIPGTGQRVDTHKPGKRFKNAARNAYLDGSRKSGQSLKDFARSANGSLYDDALVWMRRKCMI